MDGSIYDYLNKNGKKLYYVSYRVHNPVSGKKVQKMRRGFTTKKAAQEYLNSILSSISNGNYISPSNLNFGDYLLQWLSTHSQSHLGQSTFESYQSQITKHIIPKLGSISLQKLMALHLKEFYNEKLNNGRIQSKGGLSARTVQYIHRIISEALTHAVNDQLIQKNVAKSIPTIKVRKYRGEVYTLDDLQKLLPVIKGSEIEIVIILAVLLGLRRGEILGISWDQIDFSNKTLTINRQLIRTETGSVFTTPKTENSNRVLPLADNILKFLEDHKNSQDIIKSNLDSEYHDNNLVICQYNDDLIPPDNVSKRFANILKKNNLKKIRFHDLRHTFATLMLEQNQSLKTVSMLLGHTSIKTTADIYSHSLDSTKRIANTVLDTMLLGNK